MPITRQAIRECGYLIAITCVALAAGMAESLSSWAVFFFVIAITVGGTAAVYLSVPER